MAETSISEFSTVERLNKQALDVITVTLTTDAETIGDNYTDLADSSLASKSNIDLGIQSASGSTSIFASAINRSGGNYVASATTVLRMKITIQKD